MKATCTIYAGKSLYFLNLGRFATSIYTADISHGSIKSLWLGVENADDFELLPLIVRHGQAEATHCNVGIFNGAII